MEGLAREKELLSQHIRPASLDELEVTTVIATVELVADDRKAEVVEMDSDLVHAASFWAGLNKGERLGVVLEAAERAEGGTAR